MHCPVIFACPGGPCGPFSPVPPPFLNRTQRLRHIETMLSAMAIKVGVSIYSCKTGGPSGSLHRETSLPTRLDCIGRKGAPWGGFDGLYRQHEYSPQWDGSLYLLAQEKNCPLSCSLHHHPFFSTPSYVPPSQQGLLGSPHGTHLPSLLHTV